MTSRAYYSASFASFLDESSDQILGTLTKHHPFALEGTQRNAWISQIEQLKTQIAGLEVGQLFFEFAIPRMGKRADVVLLIENVIFVLEYKVGSSRYDSGALDQALDYALDLKNFHEGSHARYIVPILIATAAPAHDSTLAWFRDFVAAPLCSNGKDLAALIRSIIADVRRRVGTEDQVLARQTCALEWLSTGYKPTPTIVEAAQALYQHHTVADIARSDAGAKNLTHTADCILEVIARSREAGRKSLCFVTGAPGAGKTLAGLNISTRKVEGTEEHAVFLSGNGPLVAVLKEALARDEIARANTNGRDR